MCNFCGSFIWMESVVNGAKRKWRSWFLKSLWTTLPHLHLHTQTFACQDLKVAQALDLTQRYLKHIPQFKLQHKIDAFLWTSALDSPHHLVHCASRSSRSYRLTGRRRRDRHFTSPISAQSVQASPSWLGAEGILFCLFSVSS